MCAVRCDSFSLLSICVRMRESFLCSSGVSVYSWSDEAQNLTYHLFLVWLVLIPSATYLKGIRLQAAHANSPSTHHTHPHTHLHWNCLTSYILCILSILLLLCVPGINFKNKCDVIHNEKIVVFCAIFAWDIQLPKYDVHAAIESKINNEKPRKCVRNTEKLWEQYLSNLYLCAWRVIWRESGPFLPHVLLFRCHYIFLHSPPHPTLTLAACPH